MSASLTPGVPDADGLAPEKRILAIVTVVLGVTIAVLDGSIANLALPSIALDMHATASDAIWIINSYQIAMAICLLPLASLGEIIGYRRIYLLGLGMFTLASLACTMGDSVLQLSLARVMQGVGAAGILSVNTALIRFIYPTRLLGRAIGYNALVAGTASALGPTIAGLILHLGSWHWLFLINIPLGLVSIAIGMKALPFNTLSPRQYDSLSAVLCMLFIGMLLYAIDMLGHLQGWRMVLSATALALLSLALLLRWQSGSAPMLPLDLLRIPLFALSIGTSFCSFAAQTAMFVMLPFMLQNHLGMSAAHSGLIMTAWPIAVAVIAVFAGKWSDRISAGLLGGIGLAIMTIGLLSLLTVDQHSADVTLALRLAICGMGFGLFQSPNNRTMIGAAPRARTGAASGMLGTGRLVGQTIGASVVALVLAVSAAPYTVVLWCCVTLAGLACLVSLSRMRYQRQ